MRIKRDIFTEITCEFCSVSMSGWTPRLVKPVWNRPRAKRTTVQAELTKPISQRKPIKRKQRRKPQQWVTGKVRLCLPGTAVADETAWGWGRAAAADSNPQHGTCLLWRRCVAGLATCPAAARVIYGVCARSRLATPPHAPKSVYLCLCKYFLDYLPLVHVPGRCFTCNPPFSWLWL